MVTSLYIHMVFVDMGICLKALHLIFIRLCMYECTTHYVSRVASSKLSGI